MKKTILITFLLAAGSAFAASSEAVKLSSLGRSIFFRDNKGIRGSAGTNGGTYTDQFFNGSFTDYGYQNAAGAEMSSPRRASTRTIMTPACPGS